MRCASATASTIPSAPSTARWSNSLLLAEVYIELLGVRQAAFVDFAADTNTPMGAELAPLQRGTAAQRPAPLPSRLSPELEAAHAAFVETLGEKAIWRRFLAPADA